MAYNFYSIIIPTYNRVDEILECLDSLKSTAFPKDKFEVIVIDDGSTDATFAFLKDFEKSAPYNFRYYLQDHQGPGVAKNFGIQQAKGDFFIFIDSDVIVPKFWLIRINTALNENKADAFGGPDSYREDFSTLLKAINYSMTSFLTTGDLRDKKGKPNNFYPHSFNMGISRNLWEKINGFYSLRHGQDIEFSNRIIKSDAKVIFVDSAEVYHKKHINFRRFIKQVFNWGIARINLFKIDKSTFNLKQVVPAIVTLLLIILVILAFFLKPALYVLTGCLALSLLIIIYCMIDAAKMYKDFKPALFLPLVIPAKIIGNGLGLLIGFFRVLIFRKVD